MSEREPRTSRASADPVARRLASAALALAGLALVLAGYAVSLGRAYLAEAERYREDVRTLGETLMRQRAEGGRRTLPSPPLQLDTGE